MEDLTLYQLCDQLHLKPKIIKEFRLEGMPCNEDGNYSLNDVLDWMKETSK